MQQALSKQDETDEGYTEVFAWGADRYGQLGVGNKQGGRCYCTPRFCSFNVVIKMVACGEEHSAFITGKGQIFTVGSNSEGRLGLGDRSMLQSSTPCLVEALSRQNAIHVACGWGHTAAVMDNGDLYMWGVGEYGALGVVDPESQWFPVKVTFPGERKINAVSVSCGTRHSAIVDDKGKLYVCGAGDAGQLGTGSREKELLPKMVTAITEKVDEAACGIFHTIVLTKTGLVYSMGGNNFGQLGIGNKRSSILPVKIKDLEAYNIVRVAAGHHSAALTDKGEAFIWGTGVFGEFLTPTSLSKTSSFAAPVMEISVGGSFGAAVDKEGTVYSWGSNASGELGVGDFEPRTLPHPIRSLQGKTVTKVACGGSYAIALGKTILAPRVSPALAKIKSPPKPFETSPYSRTLAMQIKETGESNKPSNEKGSTGKRYTGKRPGEEERPTVKEFSVTSPTRAQEEIEKLKDELIDALKGEQQKRILLEKEAEDLERNRKMLTKRETEVNMEKGIDTTSHKEKLMMVERQIDQEREKSLQIIKELEEEQAKVNNLDNAKFSLERHISSLERDNEQLKDENMRLRGERIAQKAGENSRLSELLKEYEDKIEHEIDEKHRVMQDKQKEINSLRDIIPKLKGTIKEVESDKQKLEEYYREELQKLDGMIDDYKRQIAQQEEEKDELLGIHESNKARENELKNTLYRLLQKRDQLNKEANSCQNDIEQLKLQALQRNKELEQEVAKGENIKRVIEEKVQELAALRATFAEREALSLEEANKLKRSINDKAYDNEDLQNKINVKQIEIDTLNKDVVAWKQVAENVRVENEELRKIIAALETRNKQLADSLNAQLQDRVKESHDRAVQAIKNSQSPMKIKKILSGEQHMRYTAQGEVSSEAKRVSGKPTEPTKEAVMTSHSQLVKALQSYGQEDVDEGKPLEVDDKIKDPYEHERELIRQFEGEPEISTPPRGAERYTGPEVEGVEPAPPSTKQLISHLGVGSPIRKKVATEYLSPTRISYEVRIFTLTLARRKGQVCMLPSYSPTKQGAKLLLYCDLAQNL